MIDPSARRIDSLRRFGALFGLGCLGIAALVVTMVWLDPQYAEQAEQIGMSPETLALVNAVQGAVMLAVSVVIGLRVAPRLGFRSHVVERVDGGPPVLPAVRRELAPALLGAIVVGAMLVLAERFAPFALDDARDMTVGLLVRSLPLRLLYGGITEELLLRWGVMSLLAFLLWRVAARRADRPPVWVAWGAIVVAAVVFGVLHLPAAAMAYGELTTSLVAYIVGLNALGGIVFGWLFWSYSLEAAMIAHGGAHLVAVTVWLVGAGVG